MEEIVEFEQVRMYDNKDCKLNNILVRVKKSPSRIGNKMTSLLSMMDKAQDIIVIYSRALISAEIEEKLYNRNKEGVRCYFLTSQKNYEYLTNNPMKHLIIRAIEDMHSSFILIDPNGDSAGFWFPNPNLQDEKLNKRIKLEKNQISALFSRFIDLYWGSESELFFGDERPKAQSISTGAKQARTIVGKNTSIKKTDLNEIDQLFDEHIDTLTIPRIYQDKIEDVFLLDNADKAIFETGKLTKRHVLNAAETNGKQIFIGLASELFINGEGNSWVFSEDFGLHLNKTQVLQVEKWSRAQWEYVQETKIDNIDNAPIVPSNQDWENPSDQKIALEDTIERDMGTLVCKDMDEWKSEYEAWTKESKINTPLNSPDDIVYAHNIKLTRTVSPPFLLKKEGNKHKIYKLWIDYIEKIKSRCMEIEDIENTIEDSLNSFEDKKSKKLIKKHLKAQKKNRGIIMNVGQSIEAYNPNDMHNWNLKELDTDVEKLDKVISLYLEGVRELVKALEILKTEDLNEIEIQDEGKIKLYGHRKKLVDVLSKFSEQNLRDLQIDIEKKPKRTPPKVGELWEYNNRNYIIISKINEVELAKEVAIKYENAIVAVLRNK